ncbi:hypothetical protein PG993_013130 [Apiospora rasikravindrae]|uniref:Uncharacterized protein n=1 Tax=Apiospora rasikravindrae TaxID=990691 RepID=A0ABR1RWX5_9PEZI
MSPPEPPMVSSSGNSEEQTLEKRLPSPPPSATHSMLSPPPLNVGQSKGKPPAPVQIPTAHQRMLSPLHSDPSNGHSFLSPPLTGSSAESRGSAAMFSPIAPNPFSCNPVSPSSSIASNDASEHGLKRSQSVADIKDRSKELTRSNTSITRPKWRPFPNSTPSESDGEMDEMYSRQPATSRAESSISARTFPPPSHPPPSGPLPAISQVLSMGEQQQQQQQQQRPGTAATTATTEEITVKQQPSTQPPPPVPGQTGQVSSLTRSSSLSGPKISLVVDPKARPAKTKRHTREERLWLHKNYRGEANFLRAWGLSIDSEEDRDEGAALMRELCQSELEAKWIRSQQQQQTVDQRAEQLASSKNNNNSAADGGPLHVILEESNTGHSPRQLPPYGYKYPGVMVEEEPVTTIVAADHEDGVNLRIPVNPPWSNTVEQQQHLARIAAAEKHARSESEHSVLGAYLDVRMSRLD